MRPVFYYDFSSPYAYLAAERINHVMPEAPLWQPVSMGFILRATGRTPWSMQPEGPDPGDLKEIDRRIADRGLPPIKYPRGWPVESYSLLPLPGGPVVSRRSRWRPSGRSSRRAATSARSTTC
jgi:2-hydroxychromene-2-carboxylate isomerase